jgi:hypothetical protein
MESSLTDRAPALFPASLILLTYNQQSSVAAAIKAALAQECVPIEIILSDDASADGTFEILQNFAKTYTGPHHVIARRNAINLGINPHLEYLVDCAESDLIIWAAGDDISTPDRAQKVIDAHSQTGAKLFFSDAETCTKDGGEGQAVYKKALFYRAFNLKEAAISFSLFLGATAATHKSLFKAYGPLPNAHAHEDLILGFRAAMEDSIHHIPEPLVRYQEDEGVTGTQSGSRSRPGILQGQLAVLQQRLKDARTFGLAQTDPVVQKITAKLGFLAMRQRYYAPGFALSFKDLGHPLKLTHALLSEWLRDRKSRKTQKDQADG